jgi:hypothetical protein
MSRKILAAILCGVLCVLHASGQDKMLTPSASCSQVSTFDRPIMSLPSGLQQAIRDALRPAINSVIQDPGMGIDDVGWRDAKLYVIQVRGDKEGTGLYAVSWEHPQFKVNSAIWIVEVKKSGARNIGPQVARIVGSTGGYGIHIFSGSNELYPELMFAAKGFREGGGAEGLPGCFRNLGRTYTSVACPTDCAAQLNSR